MVNARTIDDCLRQLDIMSSPRYRKDFRDTAKFAKRVIAALMSQQPGSIGLKTIAQQISDKAAVSPQIVYRTKKTGAIRWQALRTRTVVRIPDRQIVGTYNAGSDWRDILEDLECS